MPSIPVTSCIREDTLRLIHELEVHRIELEMQIEQLCQVWVDLEKSLVRYTELYDFAPVGYLTLDNFTPLAVVYETLLLFTTCGSIRGPHTRKRAKR
jgi:hypothetical protein